MLQFVVTAMSARNIRQTSLVAFKKVVNNTKITVKVNSHTFRKEIPKIHILYIFLNDQSVYFVKRAVPNVCLCWNT